jgi:hypothetical protein
MVSGTRWKSLLFDWTESPRAQALGFLLLSIAGTAAAMIADAAKDWHIGSRSGGRGPDFYKNLWLFAGVLWLLLLPGTLLTLTRSGWWRVAAISTGFAVWLLISELFSPMPAASWFNRGVSLAVQLVIVWSIPNMGNRRLSDSD